MYYDEDDDDDDCVHSYICVQVQVPQPTMYPNVWSISGDQDY